MPAPDDDRKLLLILQQNGPMRSEDLAAAAGVEDVWWVREWTRSAAGRGLITSRIALWHPTAAGREVIADLLP